MKTFSDDTPQYVLASFKNRFAALFLDLSIIFLVSFPLSILIGGTEALFIFMKGSELGFGPTLGFAAARLFSGLLVSFCYYGYFYTRKSASLGKSILNLKVVCLPYAQGPTYKTAFVRDIFGKILSVFTLFIGYFMVLFRTDKRALHDIVADTVVLKRVR